MDITAQGPMLNESHGDDKNVEVPAKKGFLRRLFGHVTKKEVIKDIAAGAGITLGVRWGSVFVLGGVGLTGLPLIATSAVAASVARTAWTIHKDRKTHALETGETMSFLQWATRVETKKDAEGQDIRSSNLRKYMVSLGVSTAGAALGSYAVTDLMPRATEYLAPAMEKISSFTASLMDKISNSTMLSSVFGFVSGFSGGTKTDAVLTSGPATTVTPATSQPDVALKSWDELLANGPRELPTYVREILDTPAPAAEAAASTATETTPAATPAPGDAIQRRIEDAHAMVAETNNPIQQRIEEAHAVTATPSPVVPSAEVTEYEVKRGDNLWNIAEDHYGLKSAKDIQSAVETIAAANNMSDGVQANSLSVGQVIQLPESPAPVPGQAKLDWAALDGASASGTPATASAVVSSDTLGDFIAGLPAESTPAPPAPVVPAAVPNGATLQVTWSQNADGTIEGVVANPPSWLKPGMQVDVPMVNIR